MSWRRRLAVAFPGGLLCALSLPPWGWWPLAIAGLAAFFAALGPLLPFCAPGLGLSPSPGAQNGRRGAWRRGGLGAAFGLGMFLPGLFWVTEFHVVGYVALTSLETSFFVLAAIVMRTPVQFAGAVVLAEAARSAVPFGGLPLAGLALGQAGGPFVAGARVGGALFVLGATAAVAAASVVRSRTTIPVAVVALAFTAVGWLAPDGRASGETVRTALVQGGGIRGLRAIETDPSLVFDAHLRASERIDSSVDLILWPENTVDVITLEDSDEGETLATLARRKTATLIAGVTSDVAPDRFENVAVVWGPDGSVVDRYSKAHRVPFGEYVPGRMVFERLVDLSLLPRDAIAGTREAVVQTDVGRAAVAISYEVFFAERTRSGVRAGGQIVLVPTNAASFTTSQVPGQEVAAARLRAWETGRWVLQSAPTGYSAVIDERGRIRSRSVLGRAQVLTADAPLRVGQTIYMRVGDWPVLGAAFGLVILPWLRRVRGSRS